MNLQEVLALLPWILPPLLGAVIGYVTNALAIKMLFRPLREYRIFGVRVPFTPGIIPRQRGALARNFGQMVSEKLLTADTVMTHLHLPSTRLALSKALTTSLETYAQRSLEDLLPVGESAQGGGQDLQARLKEGFGGKSFQEFLGKVLSRLVPQILSARPSSLIKNGTLFWVRLLRLGRTFLKDHEGRERLLEFVAEQLEQLETKHRSFGQIMGESGILAVTDAVQLALPYLSQALLEWMDRPLVRVQLESTGQKFLEQILEKLSGFQRFLVSSVQYDKTLKENMPQIIQDLRGHLWEYLSNDRSRELYDSLVGGIRKILESDWRSWPKARVDNLKRLVLDGVASLYDQLGPRLLTPATAKALNSNLEPLLSQPLAEISLKLLGWNESDWQSTLHTQLNRFLNRLVEGEGPIPLLLGQSPASLFHLQESDFQKVAEYLTETALKAVGESLPKLLAGLNIQAMVEDKINGLEMKQVEGLLLMVIKKHLKWINILGAFLGALIGLSQVFFAFLVTYFLELIPLLLPFGGLRGSLGGVSGLRNLFV